jgi:hypothetical protein
MVSGAKTKAKLQTTPLFLSSVKESTICKRVKTIKKSKIRSKMTKKMIMERKMKTWERWLSCLKGDPLLLKNNGQTPKWISNHT